MTRNLKNIISTAFSLLVIFSTAACNKKANRETRYIETEEINNNVDKVFSMAKKFADGSTTMGEIEQEFNQLSPDELKSLEQKKDGALFFSLLITIGTATDESNLLLKKFFEANHILSSSPKHHAAGAALVKAMLSNKRKVEKIPDTEYQEIALVMARYPEMINNFSAADGSFDNQEFSDVVAHLDQNTASIIMPALDQDKLKTWLDWLLLPSNQQKTKPIFKSLYAKVPEPEKARLRNQLVASSKDLGSLISEADDFGIKDGLAQDEYTLLSDNPGTRYQANLLSVLAHRAIRDDDPKALGDLRTYAQKIKIAINNPSLYETMLDSQIRDMVKKALEPSKRQWLKNYFLATDSPEDLIKAAKDPTQINNNQLVELYRALIDTDAKALELAQAYDSIGKRFIHLLVERPADDQMISLVDQFLTSIGPEKEKEQLNDRGESGTLAKPIELLANRVQSEDQPTQKAKIFDRLLKNAPATAVDSLGDEKIKDYVVTAVKSFLTGGSGAANFRLMYKKIADPAKHKLMRNYLLEEATNSGSLSTQRLLLSIADSQDHWGLYAGLASDSYKLNNTDGLLLFVLSTQAKDQNGYTMLRIYAQSIKSALKANFEQQVTAAKPGLLTQLASSKREDFADYYLAHETPKNIYDATEDETKVSNSTLKELYELIIGNVTSMAQLLADEPSNGGQERFIHRLLNRSVDSAGDSLFLLTSFFTAIGIDREKAQLDDKSGGIKAFKILVDQTRKNDNSSQKTLMLERLARNAVLTNLDGVSADDLAAQVALLLKDKATFKKIYSLYASNSPQAQAMRSKLVQELYAQGNNKTKKLIKEITDPSDLWGLRSGLDSDIYEIDRNPQSAGKTSGSLLYVLTQRAIDDAGVASNDTPYNFLSEYAALIKNTLTNAYENHVNINTWDGQTITSMLRNALSGSRSYFVNTYLAQDAFEDLLKAANDQALGNQQLKDLYILAIGNDKAKAEQLANVNNGIFIHDLLKRSADIHTKTILERYINSLDPALALLQIKNMTDGKYPINHLAIPKNQDDPSAKALMFDRLLQDNDGTAASTIDADDLAKTRFFSAGISAQPTFKKLYGFLNQEQQKALRSALLRDAYDAQKTPELIGQITDNSDPWGLYGGLKTDIYEYNTTKNGQLLQVLISLAIAKNNFDSLKLSAEKIREAIEATTPKTYALYAASLNEYSSLKNELSSTPGFAEYYLVLDTTVPDFNPDLVFECSKIDKNSKLGLTVLSWLYREVINTSENVKELYNKRDNNNRNFLHLLNLKNSNDSSLKLLTDFNNQAKAQNLDLAALIAEQDNSQKNSLHYLLDKDRNDKGTKQLSERILNLVKESPAAIAAINNNLEITMMLKAIANKGNDGDLDLLFTHISNKAALAEWCADNRSNIIGAKFLAAYNAADDNNKKVMRNRLLYKTYDLGYQQSTVKGGLSDIAELIYNGFFDPDTLKGNNFDPFNTEPDSSLLGALISEAKPSQEIYLSQIIPALKPQFTAQEWQVYLNKNNIINKLANSVPGKKLDTDKKQDTAKSWLKYGD